MKLTTRAASSSGVTSGAPGAVDWPPMSMIEVGLFSESNEAMKRFSDFGYLKGFSDSVCGTSSRIGSSDEETLTRECLPPSEKESGVRLRIPMMWVFLLGSRGLSAAYL